MEFPDTNKQEQDPKIEGAVGDNAKALEMILKRVDWKFLVRAYFIGLFLLLVTLFSIIVVVKAGLSFF